MQLADLQALAERLRETLQGREFAIAGGAVRDVLLGRPVRDIDVVVRFDRRHEDWSEMAGIAERLLRRQFKDYEVRTISVSEYEDGDSEMWGVFEVDGYEPGYTLNVLLVNDDDAYLNEFPDQLSQVAYYTGAGIISSEAFDTIQTALETGAPAISMHVLPDELSEDGGYVNYRLRKLAAKYPDVHFVQSQDAKGNRRRDLESWV